MTAVIPRRNEKKKEKKKEKENVTQNWGEPFKVHKHVKKMSKALLRCQVRGKFTSLGCLQDFSTYVQVCT